MIEKKLVASENDKSTRTISIIRDLLDDPKFKDEYRTKPKFFTRNFKINFKTAILLILQKTNQSTQLHLNEFFKNFGNDTLATGSAFTQARSHLRHEIFLNLNLQP